MFYGDLTLEHNMLMFSSWTGDLIILRFSTFQCYCQLPTENWTGPITLDSTTLVYTSMESAKVAPSPSSSVGQPSAPALQQSSSSPQQTPATNGLQCQKILPAASYFKQSRQHHLAVLVDCGINFVLNENLILTFKCSVGFLSKARFRRRTFHELNLIHWIKYMKS